MMQDLRDTLTDVLVAAGFRVAQASNGHHALDVLRAAKERPRLVLVNMSMPVLSGPELVERLRSDYAKLPVVMLSAAPHSEMSIDGVAATVQKPVSRDALLAVIDETLSTS